MKGSYEIIVQDRNVKYDFVIKRNITVIRGNSGTGKTSLIDMIDAYSRLGNLSGIFLQCNVECYVLTGPKWKDALAGFTDIIVTEDSNSGYEFFKAVCARFDLKCYNANGKSNLSQQPPVELVVADLVNHLYITAP